MIPEPVEAARAHPGRSHRIDVDGVSVHAVEWVPAPGPAPGASPSPPVLLVHGLGANTLSWEPAAQLLADTLGATVTAVDLPGFGRTRAPGRPATLRRSIDVVATLLAGLGRCVVVGNSMGGAIGTAVAARAPGLVEALVLVDPALPQRRPTPADWLRATRYLPLMVPYVGGQVIGLRARLRGPARVVDASLALSVSDPARLDPDLRRRLVELSAERFGWPEAPAAYADAARTLFLHLARGLDADLAALGPAGIPTLVVHGALDRLVPVAAARDAARRHPHLALEILEDAGHAPQMEAPDELVAVTAGWLAAQRGV
ncbi:MAG TPA: alpha/beta hydrolase [Acidimicrobiia bacterium]|nr:alpha/beta hydrolase [Acidimicrobiia bacterium]